MKKLLKVLLISFLFLAIGGFVVAQDDDEDEVDNSTRSNPANFDPVKQLENPGDLLKKDQVFREILRIVPPFVVDPREDELDTFPCVDCHDNDEQKSNPEVRTMEEDHEDIKLVHGGGRFWCLTCHSDQNRDNLVSLKNQPISFNEPYLLCGQCHFQRQKDFFYGAHGKRKATWRGERKLAVCTECHNPHVPQIKERKPVSRPKVRTGLKEMEVVHHEGHMPWEKAKQTDKSH
ncbi:MAG: hypothetical protein GY786_09005 [Proteobacteria bacterium]|nr:hypothetical protein [Pseudomonadota bacterium]